MIRQFTPEEIETFCALYNDVEETLREIATRIIKDFRGIDHFEDAAGALTVYDLDNEVYSVPYHALSDPHGYVTKVLDERAEKARKIEAIHAAKAAEARAQNEAAERAQYLKLHEKYGGQNV